GSSRRRVLQAAWPQRGKQIGRGQPPFEVQCRGAKANDRLLGGSDHEAGFRFVIRVVCSCSTSASTTWTACRRAATRTRWARWIGCAAAMSTPTEGGHGRFDGRDDGAYCGAFLRCVRARQPGPDYYRGRRPYLCSGVGGHRRGSRGGDGPDGGPTSAVETCAPARRSVRPCYRSRESR